jgi:hypothetical protein
MSLYNADIERTGERKMEMKIGNVAKVEYATGEKFTGEIVKVRTMSDNRILFTIHDETVGYRSMYTDKCVSLETLELQPLD